MSDQERQIDHFVNSAAEVLPPEHAYESTETEPRIPFKTAYILTREQEDNLIKRAMERLRELEDELGRSVAGDADWFETAAGRIEDARQSFMGKRQLFEMTYKNRLEWRPFVLGGIFQKSNLVVPIARRVARQMVARANIYFFATEPWCAGYPIGVADRDLATDVGRYTQFKFDQSKQKRVLERAVERAFVLGEAVVKTTHETKEQIYQEWATVLVDAGGADILDAGGDYILDKDPWIELTEVAADPMTGEVAEIPAGRMVLKRDGVTPKPLQMIFQTKLITRKITHFRGAKSGVVFYKDFLCPLDSEIQEADCVVHLYDMPVMNLADMYQREALLGLSDEESVKATRKAVEMLRNMSHESGEAKAGKSKWSTDSDYTFERTGAGRTEPVVEIAEFHMRYDANGDGIMEDIMLVIDRRNEAPIFYDYEANVTPDGLRPFDVVRVGDNEGWTGTGAMEMFQSSQEIVDLIVNRWNLSQSNAGRVDFWSPHNTIEGDSNKDLQLNWGGTYTPKKGMTKDDILSFVTLPDIKHEALQNMFEFFLQMVMNESGVANANDSRAVGLDTAKLATSVRNIEKSGQEMFALYLSHLEPGLQDVTQRAMKLILANLHEKETFTFFEGDVQSIGSIQPADVRDLDLNVTMLLTRYRGEQLLESSMQASKIVMEYFSLSPELQERVTPLYRDMLKALQINFADEIITPMLLPPPPGAGGADPEAARRAAGAMPTGKSEPNL